jgi:hypothetical protein
VSIMHVSDFVQQYPTGCAVEQPVDGFVGFAGPIFVWTVAAGRPVDIVLAQCFGKIEHPFRAV